MDEQEFLALKLEERYDFIKDNRFYMASRNYGSFRVDLHYTGNLYIEVWKRIAITGIVWIELTTQENALSNYVDVKT